MPKGLFVLLAITACTNVYAANLALKGVNVIDVISEAVLSDQTIIISDNIISTIKPTKEINIPSDTAVIDLSGKFVSPGLI